MKTSYLTAYLEIAHKLNCTSIITDECRHRHLNYTKFTDLVYDKFCARNKMIKECLPLLPVRISNQSWEGTVARMVNLTADQLTRPCVQVALYERTLLRHNHSYGRFHEASRVDLPYCGFAWCGLDDEHTNLLSPGFCLSQSKRVFVLRN